MHWEKRTARNKENKQTKESDIEKKTDIELGDKHTEK